jgi:hypothetical protein
MDFSEQYHIEGDINDSIFIEEKNISKDSSFFGTMINFT